MSVKGGWWCKRCELPLTAQFFSGTTVNVESRMKKEAFFTTPVISVYLMEHS